MDQIVAMVDGPPIHNLKIAALEKTIAYPLDPWFHLGDPRVILAFVALVLAKVVTLAVPIAYKNAVDYLTGESSTGATEGASVLGVVERPLCRRCAPVRAAKPA